MVSLTVPWYITAFLKLLSPFIDPVTKTKMRYNEPLTDHIPSSQLMKNAGGDVDFTYDHAVFWPALDTLAKERRAARQERWEKAGKLVGESEIYLWGGDEKSVGAATKVVEEQKTEAGVAPVVRDVEEEKKAADLAEDVAKLDVKDKQEPVASA
jgi:hypothetical protein